MHGEITALVWKDVYDARSVAYLGAIVLDSIRGLETLMVTGVSDCIEAKRLRSRLVNPIGEF
ncbi:MAG: hypothetical protein M3R65_00490 [Gemmatimonadota bacterium]|nr:hypothetical protein [Gemmatimonadota bacterium]